MKAFTMPLVQTSLVECCAAACCDGAEKCLELAIYVVLYSAHYIGSSFGHRRALSVAGCGHSADRSPLL